MRERLAEVAHPLVVTLRSVAMRFDLEPGERGPIGTWRWD
jgi:hypothetical protein